MSYLFWYNWCLDWFGNNQLLSNNSVTLCAGISWCTPTNCCPKVVNALPTVITRVSVAGRTRVHADTVLLQTDRPKVGQHLPVDDYPLHGAVQRQHYSRVGTQDAWVTEKKDIFFIFLYINQGKISIMVRNKFYNNRVIDRVGWIHATRNKKT